MFHVFWIDVFDPTGVGFYIDGRRFIPATPIAFAATGNNALLQPYFSVYKASGTGTGTMQVDAVQICSER